MTPTPKKRVARVRKSSSSKAKAKSKKATKLVSSGEIIETKAKVPWDAIRVWYVRGVNPDSNEVAPVPTVADIVRRYGISTFTVEARSRREGWMVARESHQDALLREEERLAVREKARFRVRGEMAYLQTTLRIQQQAARKVVNDELTAGDLQKVAGALRTSQQVFQVSLGAAADGLVEVMDWTLFSRKPAQKVIDVFADEDGTDVEEV
jgi:hypothetical protein